MHFKPKSSPNAFSRNSQLELWNIPSSFGKSFRAKKKRGVIKEKTNKKEIMFSQAMHFPSAGNIVPCRKWASAFALQKLLTPYTNLGDLVATGQWWKSSFPYRKERFPLCIFFSSNDPHVSHCRLWRWLSNHFCFTPIWKQRLWKVIILLQLP